ncbi:hypothetical protein [uncultured Alcanivorax sp.]|uniref:hypothetical protein n=1 Tax=Sulfitobacter sp. R86518 TaxID=3093858 RepID=UPI0025FC8223|nr:hypothetical protein [uncultured Alcanivorax sp.]
MSDFKPEELQKRLNSDSDFRVKFASDPKSAIAEYGGDVSDDDAEKLKAATAPASTMADDTVSSIIPVPYPIPIR